MPEQFAAGMYGSVYSTDKMENMQSIPRLGASHTVRGAAKYGKSAPLEIMRSQDRRATIDCMIPKAVERKLRKSEKNYGKRMLRLRPVQLKKAVDALNLKTLDDLTAAGYESAVASMDGTENDELLDEQEEQGEDFPPNAGPVDGDFEAAVADDGGNGAGAGAGADGAGGGDGAGDDDDDYDDDAAFENTALDEITDQLWEQGLDTLADPLAEVQVLPT